MPSLSECPSDDVIQRLIDGTLSLSDVDVLTGHLEVCSLCQTRLDRLAGAVDSWQSLKGKFSVEGPDSSALQGVIADLNDLHAETRTAAAPFQADDGTQTFEDRQQWQAGEIPKRIGPYEVQGLVGQGGMGRVLKAFDPTLRRVVAIKLMVEQLAANGAARQRFVREARAVAAIAHEHVVSIHHVDEFNGLPYLVMQFVSGQSLQDRLEKSGHLELKEILRIGMQTAQGLAAAHAQGIIHRDVKPGNILLENGVERVKLTDFGLARAVDDASVSQSGIIAGTPLYMSPEQARGEAVDHRSDLFSLGSVLYAMCAGRAPFRASGTLAVLKRVCEDTPRPIREINPDVPDWLCEIVGTLHAKDPTERYQSAADVAEILGKFLSDLQTAQPIRSPEMQTDSAATLAKVKPPSFKALIVFLLVTAIPGVAVTIHQIDAGNLAESQRGGLTFAFGIQIAFLLLFVGMGAAQRVALKSRFRVLLAVNGCLGTLGVVAGILLRNRGETYEISRWGGTVLTIAGVMLLIVTALQAIVVRLINRPLVKPAPAMNPPRLAPDKAETLDEHDALPGSGAIRSDWSALGVLLLLLSSTTIGLILLLRLNVSEWTWRSVAFAVLLPALSFMSLVMIGVSHHHPPKRRAAAPQRYHKLQQRVLRLGFSIAAFLSIVALVRWQHSPKLRVVCDDPDTQIVLSGGGFLTRSFQGGGPSEGIIQVLEPGTYRLEVYKDGWTVHSEEVVLGPFESRRIELSLWGSVRAINKSIGIILFLDGVEWPESESFETAKSIRVGKHHWWALDRNGAEVASGDIFVQSGKTQVVEIPVLPVAKK